MELSREQVCCQTVIDLLRLRTKVFSLQGPGIEKLNIRDQFNLFGLISYVMMSGDNMPLILDGCRYNSINGCLYYSINGCLYYGGKGCRQANSLKELNNIELSRSAAVVWLGSYSDLSALEGRGEWRTGRRPRGRRLVRWPACSAA